MTDILEWYQKGKQQALCAMMWRIKGLYEFDRVIDGPAFDRVADAILAYAETKEDRDELLKIRDEEVKE